MIVSHRNKFIFVAVPKTGGHSVREALRPHLGPEDLEQASLFVQKSFPFPELSALKHGHIGLSEVRPFLGEGIFKSYLKFAFIRNPFDRFVSYCSFMTRHQGHFDRDPRGTMRHFLFDLRPLYHVHFQPQSRLLVDGEGRLLTDFLGHVESMQADFDEICLRVGVPATPLERMNSSRRGEYKQYYDQELIDGVASLYERDLNLFGYSF